MYTPRVNVVEDQAEIRALVAAVGSGWLVTSGDDGFPVATLVPVMWIGDTVVAHLAKANRQWRGLVDDTPALVICGGAEAYISPNWYASKREHGRVVPTWNYTAVHLSGTLRCHHDPAWLRTAVTELTNRHEAGRPSRWRVDDAPAAFVDGQLRGIVGVEIAVTKVEGKAKLSQNRSAADRRGVVEGLTGEQGTGPAAIAAAMGARIEG